MRHLRYLLGAFLLLLAAPVLAQSLMERLVSPGALSTAHAKLESHCDSCHSSFKKTAQNGKCTACHRDVGGDVARGGGFHGKFAPARAGSCNACHSDHKGRGFALVKLDRGVFNHALTDYALTGAHAGVTCAGCHAAGKKFRAAPNDCATCHAKKDPHRGQLGRECQSCHVTAAWKQVQPFDHSRTGFALTGKHRQAECLSCHAGQRWKGLATTCASCHARDDAHKGSRGSNCAQCHSTAGWKQATFDHASTGFALSGGHASVSCASCHGAGNSKPHPTRACIGCHVAKDVHKGANGTDCAQCHNARAWKQVSFDHDRMTRFPLRGGHREANCEACHKQPPRIVKLAVTCVSCHAADDRHKGGNGPECQRCHTETSWKISKFDHDKMTRFALVGKHAAVKCEACHIKPTSEVKPSAQCGSCHAKSDVHAGRLGQSCGNCHDSVSWKARVRFDHELTRFPLLGKHAGLTCTACHADRSFAAKGTQCADCHSDDHHKGAFGKPAACGRCHTTATWKSWSFDHDKMSRFALTGKHQGLICSACHIRAGDPAKVASQCADCHRRDDIHHGGFGEDCGSCHVTSDFRQIRLDAKR